MCLIIATIMVVIVGISLSVYFRVVVQVQLRWFSKHGSVADFVERPTWEPQAEQTLIFQEDCRKAFIFFEKPSELLPEQLNYYVIY